MELCQAKRAATSRMDYLSRTGSRMRYTLPMGEIVFDFFDQLKSRTKGYASLDYERSARSGRRPGQGRHPAPGEPVDAFSAIVHREAAYSYGVMMAGKLKELIPRPAVRGPIQAAIGAGSSRARTSGRSARRARQALRRRHHPQAQAAGEAEGGQSSG